MAEMEVMCVIPCDEELVKTKPLIIPMDGGKEFDKVLVYSWSKLSKTEIGGSLQTLTPSISV